MGRFCSPPDNKYLHLSLTGEQAFWGQSSLPLLSCSLSEAPTHSQVLDNYWVHEKNPSSETLHGAFRKPILRTWEYHMAIKLDLWGSGPCPGSGVPPESLKCMQVSGYGKTSLWKVTVITIFFITSPEGHHFRIIDDSTVLIAQAGVLSPQVCISEVCQYCHLLQSFHPISKENPQATTRLRGWVKCWGNKNESNIVSALISFYVSGTTLYFWEQFILTVSMSLFLIYTQRLNKARTTRTPVKEIDTGRCCG